MMAEGSNRWDTASVSAVREQLARMLASPLFEHSERQSRFLRYIVEETLTGRGRHLNQFVIGVEVFDRDASFDPAVDSIVRVEAGRLRAKLREYYGEVGQADPVRILLPKGRYTAVIQIGPPAAPSPPAANDVAGPAASPARPVIAVLPFDNRSGDEKQEYFSDGIAEDLVTELSRLSGLGVISSATSLKASMRRITSRLPGRRNQGRRSSSETRCSKSTRVISGLRTYILPLIVAPGWDSWRRKGASSGLCFGEKSVLGGQSDC
jgi:hypothetical protein